MSEHIVVAKQPGQAVSRSMNRLGIYCESINDLSLPILLHSPYLAHNRPVNARIVGASQLAVAYKANGYQRSQFKTFRSRFYAYIYIRIA